MTTPEDQPEPIPPQALARIRELQAMITESQRKADRAEDEDIREALNLQISRLGLKVARLKRGMPEELPDLQTAQPPQELEPIVQPTAEQLQEAEMLIRRAVLEKRRGNSREAGDLLKQAAEVAPGSATVLEALGDDLVERKQHTAALAAFKAAHRADPTNASIERKYAQLSMAGLGSMTFEQQMMMAESGSPFLQEGDSFANPKIAVVLSVFFPGLGQLVAGQSKKGLTILGICLAAVIVFVLLCPRGASGSVGLKNIPTLAWFFLIVALAAWFGGILDATSRAKGVDRAQRTTVSKPVPPVNLPYE